MARYEAVLTQTAFIRILPALYQRRSLLNVAGEPHVQRALVTRKPLVCPRLCVLLPRPLLSNAWQ